jgi:hypothetical protein
MAERVIYKLTEYNCSTGEDKDCNLYNLKEHLENEFPTVSEDQEITKINFDTNDMESLCDALNNSDENYKEIESEVNQ